MRKRTALFTAIVLALFLLAAPIYAADMPISENCRLADAIEAANNDEATGGCPAGEDVDIISLSADIALDAELPPITSEIIIEGNGYTISGGNRYRIFVVDGGDLTINDLTLTAGKAQNKGNPVVDNDRNLVVSADNALGGAILNDGALTVSSSDFRDNSADYMGGAILNNGAMTIIDSRFSGNSAGERGGAAYIWSGRANISNSDFTDNSAEDGGAVYGERGTLTINDSRFSDNSARHEGGAVYGERGALTIIDSRFSDNSAGWKGGAVHNWFGKMDISGSSFSGNSARGSDAGGGAVYNEGTLAISGSSFIGNLARVIGGAIHNEDSLTISNSSFIGNSARYGGGLFVSDNANFQISTSRSTLTQVTLADNSASSGGGIYAADRTIGAFSYVESTVIMRNSIIARSSGGDCVGELLVNTNNFIQDDSCSPAFSGNPRLGARVEPEDGSTAHYPLMVDSPAIGAADEKHCPDTDQVGTERPQEGACAIGAIEYTTTIGPEDTLIITSTTSLNVRRGPNTTYGVADGLQRGEEAVAIGRDADGAWVQIDAGWVFAQLIETVGSIMTLPVTSG